MQAALGKNRDDLLYRLLNEGVRWIIFMMMSLSRKAILKNDDSQHLFHQSCIDHGLIQQTQLNS